MRRKLISAIIIIVVILLGMGNVYATKLDETVQITQIVSATKTKKTTKKSTDATKKSTVTTPSSTINTNTYEPQELTEKDYKKAFDMTSNIVGTLTMVGIVVSITMVMVLGIKYMIGSVEEKAEYKKTMIPILIGTILLFTASTIVSIIYQLVKQL